MVARLACHRFLVFFFCRSCTLGLVGINLDTAPVRLALWVSAMTPFHRVTSKIPARSFAVHTALMRVHAEKIRGQPTTALLPPPHHALHFVSIRALLGVWVGALLPDLNTAGWRAAIGVQNHSNRGAAIGVQNHSNRTRLNLAASAAQVAHKPPHLHCHLT